MYYSEIAWYLFKFHRKFVSQPELWGRLRTQHSLGKHGYKWKFAEGTQRIESRELDVVNMENRRSGNYIVALAHDKVTGQEIPLPMGINQASFAFCARYADAGFLRCGELLRR